MLGVALADEPANTRVLLGRQSALIAHPLAPSARGQCLDATRLEAIDDAAGSRIAETDIAGDAALIQPRL
jgi:hypothetical protein